jgi:acyl-CoA reductase-like NAD-dependent aldehyde dehydrogenase
VGKYSLISCGTPFGGYKQSGIGHKRMLGALSPKASNILISYDKK